jgi:hypothetical protein
MRTATFGLTVVLVCVDAFAQNTTPQWKVVKAIQVVQGTAQVPITNLFTPTASGPYRFTGYIACNSTTTDLNASWDLNLYWNDSTGTSQFSFAFCDFIQGEQSGTVGPLPFTPQPGVPVQFQIQQNGSPPPLGSTYTFWFTIEHLE